MAARADAPDMASQLAAVLPRLIVLALVAALAGTGTATFAAAPADTPAPAVKAAADPGPAVLVVPDVRRQAYVFAKGTLEDAGFTWRVVGPVAGYSANVVVSQEPPPGARVLDTGGPTILLRLARNAGYVQHGTPENRSPHRGTPARLAGAPATEVPAR